MEEEAWKFFDENVGPTIATVADERPSANSHICACGGVKRISNRDITCTSCGAVDPFFISSAAEWTDGPSDGGGAPTVRSRVGAPDNSQLYNSQLGTMVRTKYPGYRTQLSKAQMRTCMNGKDRCLYQAYLSFDAVRERHGVSTEIVDRGKVIYRHIAGKILTRGAKRKGIMGNCLLHALKESNVPTTTRAVAVMFDIAVKDITRTRNMFLDNAGEIVKTASADDLLLRCVARMSLDLKERISLTKRARKNLEAIRASKLLSGKTPSGVVAAAIWSAGRSEDFVDEALVAFGCGVSVPTVIKLYNCVDTLLT